MLLLSGDVRAKGHCIAPYIPVGQEAESMTAELWARAKINLTLGIVGRREDGYHLLSSVMQSVSLADRVVVTRLSGNEPKIDLWTSFPYVPRDSRNTTWKAVEAFAEYTGIPVRVRIAVHKVIPVGAGLAGGSADAAAVLRGLDQVYETNLSLETLANLGLSVGADVPFCLMGGTKLAKGIGEKLTELPPLPFCHIVLCKPPESLKTKDIFAAFDAQFDEIGAEKVLAEQAEKEEKLLLALEKQDLAGIAMHLTNGLLSPALARCSHIEKIMGCMRENGALGTMMSGSGPTVFGIFTSRRRAEQTAAKLKSKYRETYVTNPTKPSGASQTR